MHVPSVVFVRETAMCRSQDGPVSQLCHGHIRILQGATMKMSAGGNKAKKKDLGAIVPGRQTLD